MPKNKTNKATAKRVRVTGSGKLRRQQTHLRHHMEKKPSHRTRRLTGTVEVSGTDSRRLRRLLGL